MQWPHFARFDYILASVASSVFTLERVMPRLFVRRYTAPVLTESRGCSCYIASVGGCYRAVITWQSHPIFLHRPYLCRSPPLLLTRYEWEARIRRAFECILAMGERFYARTLCDLASRRRHDLRRIISVHILVRFVALATRQR